MPVRAKTGGQGRVRTGRVGAQIGSGSSPGSPTGDGPAFTTDFTALSSLPAEFSLSRATTGTRSNSSGVLVTEAINAPRFDYSFNGSVWVAAGLLVEGQRTNSILQSNNLTDAAWFKISLTVTSGVADPDGGTSAFTLTATANGGQIYQPVTGASGAASFWIRRRTGTGQISNRINGSSDVALSVTSAWQRLSDVGAGGGGSAYVDLVLATNGDAIDVCRCQQEIGSTFFTSYTPTTSAAITRSADILSSNSPLTGYLSAGPSVWEFKDEATGTISRSAYAAGAFDWPVDKWYRSMGVYAAGTDTSGHMTVGSPY